MINKNDSQEEKYIKAIKYLERHGKIFNNANVGNAVLFDDTKVSEASYNKNK